MDVTAGLLIGAGFVSVMVAWGTYLATIPGGTVPERPTAWVIATGGGALAAIAGLVWGAPGILGVVLASFAILMGGFFVFLIQLRKTPIGDIRVSVGDALLPFTATHSSGEPFHTDAFSGKRVLLKFFRGGW